jgi:DNA mismatch repair ATPase MutS
MQQYKEIKAQYPDCLVMMRLGDFYELFFEDAKTASNALELVLTGRDCGLEERAPMCGVPHHALDTYLAKLVTKGFRVAIVEQLEDPATAKGLVKRGVTRVVTAGTVFESSMLNEKRNNFLCAVYPAPDGYGVVFADFSTGEVFATDIRGEDANRKLASETAAYSPCEFFFVPGMDEPFLNELSYRYCAMLTEMEAEDAAEDRARAEKERKEREREAWPSSPPAPEEPLQACSPVAAGSLPPALEGSGNCRSFPAADQTLRLPSRTVPGLPVRLRSMASPPSSGW